MAAAPDADFALSQVQTDELAVYSALSPEETGELSAERLAVFNALRLQQAKHVMHEQQQEVHRLTLQLAMQQPAPAAPIAGVDVIAVVAAVNAAQVAQRQDKLLDAPSLPAWPPATWDVFQRALTEFVSLTPKATEYARIVALKKALPSAERDALARKFTDTQFGEAGAWQRVVAFIQTRCGQEEWFVTERVTKAWNTLKRTTNGLKEYLDEFELVLHEFTTYTGLDPCPNERAKIDMCIEKAQLEDSARADLRKQMLTIKLARANGADINFTEFTTIFLNIQSQVSTVAASSAAATTRTAQVLWAGKGGGKEKGGQGKSYFEKGRGKDNDRSRSRGKGKGKHKSKGKDWGRASRSRSPSASQAGKGKRDASRSRSASRGKGKGAQQRGRSPRNTQNDTTNFTGGYGRWNSYRGQRGGRGGAAPY